VRVRDVRGKRLLARHIALAGFRRQRQEEQQRSDRGRRGYPAGATEEDHGQASV
jgi:hypothetical protein